MECHLIGETVILATTLLLGAETPAREFARTYIPIPPKPIPQEKRPLTPEPLARLADQRRHRLRLGATIFDHRLSVVHWQHPDTSESYNAACGFDLGLLDDIGQFVRDGETYSVDLMHSNYPTNRFRNIAARMFPNLPAVPVGSHDETFWFKPHRGSRYLTNPTPEKGIAR